MNTKARERPEKKYVVGFLNGRKSHCGIIIFLRKKIPTIFFFLRKQKSHNIIFYFFFKLLRVLLGLEKFLLRKKMFLGWFS